MNFIRTTDTTIWKPGLSKTTGYIVHTLAILQDCQARFFFFLKKNFFRALMSLTAINTCLHEMEELKGRDIGIT